MTKLINAYGWYMPSREKDFLEFFRANNTSDYQIAHREHALRHCQSFRTVIDVGANIGTWSRPFADRFETVIAFEPQPDCREAFEINLKNYSNVTLHPYALGNKEEVVKFFYEEKATGNAGTSAQGVIEGPTDSLLTYDDLKSYPVEQRKLDSFEFENVDLIKIDVQGTEELVLDGARKTLEIHKPVLCVELPIRTPEEKEKKHLVKLKLLEWGFFQRGSVSKDTVFAHKDNIDL